ncbi:hypothetical protein GQ457_09G016080 [Hibiscus cannabinus]
MPTPTPQSLELQIDFEYQMYVVIIFTKVKIKFILGKMLKFGVEPTVAPLSTWINGLCKQSQQKQATWLLNEMADNNISLNIGCALTIRIYGNMINEYRKAKRLDKAMELFHEISQNGPTSDIVTYNTLMQGMCQNLQLSSLGWLFPANDSPYSAPLRILRVNPQYCNTRLQKTQHCLPPKTAENVTCDLLPISLSPVQHCRLYINVTKEMVQRKFLNPYQEQDRLSAACGIIWFSEWNALQLSVASSFIQTIRS